jgi:hypothetical protein
LIDITQGLVEEIVCLLKEGELLLYRLVIGVGACLAVPVHDSGADRNDRQEHQLQEIGPIENLLLVVRPQQRRQSEDDECVKGPD